MIVLCVDGAGTFAIRSEDLRSWSKPQRLFDTPFFDFAHNRQGDVLVTSQGLGKKGVSVARFDVASGSWSFDFIDNVMGSIGDQYLWGHPALGDDGTAAVMMNMRLADVHPVFGLYRQFVSVASPGGEFSPLQELEAVNSYSHMMVVDASGRVDVIYPGVYGRSALHRWRDPVSGEWSVPTTVCCYTGGFWEWPAGRQLVSDGQGRLLLLERDWRWTDVGNDRLWEQAILYFDGRTWSDRHAWRIWSSEIPSTGVSFPRYLAAAGGSGRLYLMRVESPADSNASVTRILKVDAETGDLVDYGKPTVGPPPARVYDMTVGTSGDAVALWPRVYGGGSPTSVDYVAVRGTTVRIIDSIPLDSGKCGFVGGAINGRGQGILVGVPCYGSTNYLPFALGDSCVRVPDDGGPLDAESIARMRPKADADQNRSSLRFGAVEAVGCFEPLAKSDSGWAKVVSTAGMWVNSAPMTRINGIDVPADPGTLLFDTKAMRISWLPTTEVALSLQGVVFFRGMSKGSFKNPFSIKVSTGKTVLNLTGKDLVPVKGKPRQRVLGMDLANDVGVRLELGVDGDGGYTQVSVTLGFDGSFDPTAVPISQVQAVTPCRVGERNKLTRVATVPDPGTTDYRYFRCEFADPLDPDDGFAWMPVKQALVSPGIAATVRTSNKSGLEVKQVKGVLGHVVAGPLMLENVELSYTPATSVQRALWSFKATGGMRFGAGPLGKVKPTVGGTIAEPAASGDPMRPSGWSLQGVSVGVQAQIPIGGPFSLTRLQMDIDRGDDLGGFTASGTLGLSGGIPITIGPNEFDAFSIDGTLTYTSARTANPDDTTSRPTPAQFTVQGTGSLAGAPVGQLTVKAALAGNFPAAITKLDVDGDINLSGLREKWKWIKRLGVSGSAKIVGFVNVSGEDDGKYQLQGAVRDLSIDRLKVGPFGGDIMISDRGIAVCAQASTVSLISTGFSYLYDTKKVKTHLTGCDVAIVKSTA